MDEMLPSPKPIRAYMKQRGFTQKEFGDLVDASQSAVSQWLRGKTRMSFRTAKRIEARTGIKLRALFPNLFGGGA